MAVSVSIEADRIYTSALKALADRKRVTVAQLVREAVDEKLGEQLKPYIDFFVAQSGDNSLQSGPGNPEPASA